MQFNRRNATQPTLNRDSPLASGLLAWVPYDRNLIVAPGGTSTVTGGPAVVGADIGGAALQYSSAGTQYISMTNVLSQMAGSSGPYTFLLWFYGSVATAYTTIFDSIITAGSIRQLSLFVGPGANKFAASGSNGAGAAWTLNAGSADFTSFEWQLCGFRVRPGATTADVIRNGLVIGTTGTIGPFGVGDLSWGRNVSTGGALSNMARSDGAMWTRSLSDSEVWSMYEPSTRWQLYWNRRVTYFDIASSGLVYWGGVFGGGNARNWSTA